jgi:superfamily II DNA or RNA helicase
MDRDTGYRSDFLYIPRSRVGVFMEGALKRSLTFDLEGRQPVEAWKIVGDHLRIPRERLLPSEVLHLPFEIVETSPKSYPTVPVSLTYTLRDSIQEESRKALVGSSGVLSLSCGKGKTVVALHAWAAAAVPALIVVPTKDLAWQWKTRIAEHTSVDEEDVGWLSGKPEEWDWKKPISIATVHAVARAAENIAEEIRRHWGVVIFDEVHRLGAPYFNRAAAVSYGMRWGLSATPLRKDGLDVLYQSHIGPVIYENLTQENIPRVYFVQTGVSDQEIPPGQLTDRSGDLNIPKLYTWLSEHDKRNQLVRWLVRRTAEKGRVNLVLTERVNHVQLLHNAFPGAGVIHGKVKGEERESALKDHQTVFAITQLARDGLDRPDLNTVTITLPFTDRGRFEQIIGRAQRSKNPAVIILEDDIDVCRKMCRRLKTHLRDLGYPFKSMRRDQLGEREKDDGDGPAEEKVRKL